MKLTTKACRNSYRYHALSPYTPTDATVTISASSSFRRYAPRDERRRRLLTDDLYEQDNRTSCRVWTDDASDTRKSENYGNAEFLEQQLRLLDLVPRRKVILAALFSAAAGTIVGLEFAYSWMAQRAAAGAETIAALNMADGGLAGCFSSLMLIVAVVAALLVYSVRRHRVDDYQGRYRIWIWAAAGCFLLATDQAAGLRAAFRDLMIAATGTPLMGNGNLWWIVAYAIIFGAIGSRVLLDVRNCVPALIAISGATVAHGLAVAQHFGWNPFANSAELVMSRVGCEMAGNLLLLFGFAIFARHVVFDAEGLLPHKCKNDQGEEEDEDNRFHSDGHGRWIKIDPPHVAPKPSHQRSPKTTPAPVSRKLTKAERKVMKKRLLQERMERERRGK